MRELIQKVTLPFVLIFVGLFTHSVAFGNITNITLDGANLFFFDEVFELLEGISHPPKLKKQQQGPGQCESLIDLNDDLGNASVATSCDALVRSYDTVNSALSICQRIDQPLTYFSYFTPTHPVAGESATLEGIIRLIGVSMSNTQMPAIFHTPKYRNMTEDILLKISSKVLLNKLSSAIQNIDLLRLEMFESDCSKSQARLVKRARQELNSARIKLNQLVVKGRRQANIDQQKIISGGKMRKLNTNLSDKELKWMAMAIGGASWRMRGAGGYKKVNSTQFLRIQYLLNPFSTLSEILSQNEAVGVAIALYSGIFKGYSKFFDMGRSHGNKHDDHKSMIKRGQFQTKMAANLLKWQGYNNKPLKSAGIQMGHCYYYTWEKLTKTSFGQKLKSPLEPWANRGDAIAWGEMCTGAALGLGMAKSLLEGY